MKRISNNKRGFSLAEVILVVAIIVILAAVVAMSVSTYINTARRKSNEAADERRSVIGNIADEETRMNALGFDRVSTVAISTT
jgi:prepilin-type N-terminal cleavage/methylation domain-containing protein